MARISLESLNDIDGFIAAALVDSDSGLSLAAIGNGIDLELAAAGNTEVLRAKRKVANALNLNDSIDDILITLGKQYHLIRPLESNDALFLYLVLSLCFNVITYKLLLYLDQKYHLKNQFYFHYF